MTKKVLFDQSLDVLAEVVCRELGEDDFRNGLVFRDSTGRLSFVAKREPVSHEERQKVGQALESALGAYARQGRPVLFLGDPGARNLLDDPLSVPAQAKDLPCQLLDRRIVGSAWLDEPLEASQTPPRVVFASLKGGVGRSTALAVVAVEFARTGRNVLVIDLDLEAPGIGCALLSADRLPNLGVVDFLVENGIGGIDEAQLSDFVGLSDLTGAGRVDVVPALGLDSMRTPENILPKLARAMIEDVKEGDTITVAEQIAVMIDRLTARSQYDVVLVDSRAGLAELTAPALLRLGAIVLLFSTAQQQTIDGYRALFAGLKLLAERDRNAGRTGEWRVLLKAVLAKASLSEATTACYRDDLYDLFAEYLYDAEQPGTADEGQITYAMDDRDAPHFPLVIPFNDGFLDFDPVRHNNHLTQPFYEQTFRPFLDGLEQLIFKV